MVKHSTELVVNCFQVGRGITLATFVGQVPDLVLPLNNIFCGNIAQRTLSEIGNDFLLNDAFLCQPGVLFKAGLITAASLVTIGVILFAAVMTAYHWDFSLLSTDRFETNTYEISEEFSDIKLNTETADILFAVSSDNMCRVVCCEEENMKHSVSVQDGTLTVSFVDDRTWYEHIGFSFLSPKVTVYLPKAEYASLVIKGSTGDITLQKDFTFGSMDLSLSTGHVNILASSFGLMRIETSTGDIRLQDLSAGELDLTVSTGHVDAQSVFCEDNVGICVSTGDTRLTDISCNSINSNGGTGSITLKNVITEKMISIERSTGDVRLEGCDAYELEINTDTGNVTGSLLSSKVFIAHSDTGDIDVPETTSGGKCKITTDTGNIRITIN